MSALRQDPDVVRKLRRNCLLGALLLCGCAGSGSAPPSGAVYVGAGYYDPWYWGPCCNDTAVIVGPPGGRPPDGRPSIERPAQPIAKPMPSPRPTPMPRPAARGGGRR